jgi:hypothetical protein
VITTFSTQLSQDKNLPLSERLPRNLASLNLPFPNIFDSEGKLPANYGRSFTAADEEAHDFGFHTDFKSMCDIAGIEFHGAVFKPRAREPEAASAVVKSEAPAVAPSPVIAPADVAAADHAVTAAVEGRPAEADGEEVSAIPVMGDAVYLPLQSFATAGTLEHESRFVLRQPQLYDWDAKAGTAGPRSILLTEVVSLPAQMWTKRDASNAGFPQFRADGSLSVNVVQQQKYAEGADTRFPPPTQQFHLTKLALRPPQLANCGMPVPQIMGPLLRGHDNGYPPVPFVSLFHLNLSETWKQGPNVIASQRTGAFTNGVLAGRLPIVAWELARYVQRYAIPVTAKLAAARHPAGRHSELVVGTDLTTWIADAYRDGFKGKPEARPRVAIYLTGPARR